MIATITVQSHRMNHSQEHHRFSRTSNTAGAPLPAIPRRTSSSTSSRPALASSSSCPLPPQGSLSASFPVGGLSTVTITPATPPKNEDESSSNSDATRQSRRKRKSEARTVNPNALYPPELSTPIPPQTATRTTPTHSSQNGDDADATPRPAAPRPMMYVPGMSLRLSLESLKIRNSPHSRRRPAISTSVSLPASASTSSITSPTEPPLIRKKSGQVVRSSLKSSRSSSRCQDNLVVLNPAFPSSKSEPATPTASKAVHFDANLEQVKLFLAEQKPLAVSRDGSPTDDTSGTDSDFPWFIYGHGESASRPGAAPGVEFDEKKSKLVMHSNMPPRAAPFHPLSDVSLEDLTLSLDAANIMGHVIVRNIAFNKSIAVRFTFDKWQTTSEVLAKWQESVGREKLWDRFSFSIRLNDLILMKREEVEGKRLELAVRYSVDGRDIWDNNNGKNYVATFVKVQQEKEQRERGRPSASMATKKIAAMAKAALTFSDDELGDLQSKLKAAASGQSIARSPSPTKVSDSMSAAKSPSGFTADDFKKGASFAARYDFANSSKNPWTPPTSTAPALHTRTQSFPLPSTTSSSMPWQQQMGSIYGSEHQGLGLGIGAHSGYIPSRKAPPAVAHPVHQHQRPKPTALLGSPRDIDDSFHSVPFPTQKDDVNEAPTVPSGRIRNHQRGYFDIPRDFGSPRRTPSGTPRSPLEITSEDFWNPLEVTPTPSSMSRFNSFPPVNAASSSTSPSPQLTPVGDAIPKRTASIRGGVGLSIDVKSPLPTISTNHSSVYVDLSSDSSEPETASTEISVTPSSSRSSTPPSPGPRSLPGDSDTEVEDKNKHYHELLAKFCFFTGSGAETHISPNSLLSAKDTIPRPSSASDIDRLLSESSPPLRSTLPTTTLDDLAMITKTSPRSRSNSGSSTPTPSASLADLTLTPSPTTVLA